MSKSLYTAASLPADWQGRDDGPGPEHARWHTTIAEPADVPGIALLGFASDEGVSRNGGRIGAAEGPAALRRALASLAVHTDTPLYDAGTVSVTNTDLESGHDALSAQVSSLTKAGHLVIVLGGGHETAFGSHRGLRQGLDEVPTIINLDAHFDLRTADIPTSGTPFQQIADLVGPEFSYAVLGISEPNNTRTLFDTAAQLNIHVSTDEEMVDLSPAECAALAVDCVRNHQAIHLSIDLDVLPAATAPGVSAPASLGVEMAKIHAIVSALAATGKLRLVDVVELNPRLDIDDRTAKAAARLVSTISHRAAQFS